MNIKIGDIIEVIPDSILDFRTEDYKIVIKVLDFPHHNYIFCRIILSNCDRYIIGSKWALTRDNNIFVRKI